MLVQVAESLKSPFAFDSGLLSALAGRATTRDPRGAIQRAVLRQQGELVGDLLADCVDRLGIGQAMSDVVLHSLEDLCRNVFHHAATQGGGAHVTMSHDRGRRLVRLGVADCGRGIAQDIRSNYGDSLSDVQAVTAAIQPKVSGRSAQSGLNLGVGLYVVRKLALAAKGAFWIRTGSVRVQASATSPEAMTPRVDEVGTPWQGTAVGVVLNVRGISDFASAISAIRDDIEGRGPHYRQVQFFKTAGEDDLWTRIRLVPDSASMAMDRMRALSVRESQLEPLLAQGKNAILDFSDVRSATQAFAYALLAESCGTHGPALLARLRFVSCSAQVISVVRLAINAGLVEPEIPNQPEEQPHHPGAGI
ncbi:MAG: DUF4325 domain-containing protein [Planctomycetes bacterium]|nr:DUF4325 domain-containing protein [Planctomycetota bacterium]